MELESWVAEEGKVLAAQGRLHAVNQLAPKFVQGQRGSESCRASVSTASQGPGYQCDIQAVFGTKDRDRASSRSRIWNSRSRRDHGRPGQHGARSFEKRQKEAEKEHFSRSASSRMDRLWEIVKCTQANVEKYWQPISTEREDNGWILRSSSPWTSTWRHVTPVEPSVELWRR